MSTNATDAAATVRASILPKPFATPGPFEWPDPNPTTLTSEPELLPASVSSFPTTPTITPTASTTPPPAAPVFSPGASPPLILAFLTIGLFALSIMVVLGWRRVRGTGDNGPDWIGRPWRPIWRSTPLPNDHAHYHHRFTGLPLGDSSPRRTAPHTVTFPSHTPNLFPAIPVAEKKEKHHGSSADDAHAHASRIQVVVAIRMPDSSKPWCLHRREGEFVGEVGVAGVAENKKDGEDGAGRGDGEPFAYALGVYECDADWRADE
ncbi:hypothetical protein DXG03_002957 [Asterophora parasitica]|uniref:Uncharacterized protein n=1 Tax=Asterophora parasitica TaxID=117018 RepID=A0A9P7KAY4_9AGAR|nr:hypothetical protein DXG03_002957 [Asterophora parasitica]